MIAALLAADGPSIGISLAVILGVGVFAQWLAWRTQIPSIIALLVAGLILGGVFEVDPEDLLGDTLFPLVSLSVALILFEGGLDLPPRELRNTGTVVRRLISLGAILTFVVAAWGAHRIFDLPAETAIVLGTVLVVTGPTVVGPLLRFVRPSHGLESGGAAVLVRGDSNVDYGAVVAAMSLLQQAGAEKVGLITEPVGEGG